MGKRRFNIEVAKHIEWFFWDEAVSHNTAASKSLQYKDTGVSFAAFDYLNGVLCKMHSEHINKDDIDILKENKAMQEEVDITVYTYDRGWENKKKAAEFDGTLLDGLLHLYNHKEEYGI